ncbi:MAG: ribonuclease H-like domain-containing protein [Thermaerobacter sp.]|nr:MAG: hypothetical protein DIU84_02715 [Bacillota bacterium]
MSLRDRLERLRQLGLDPAAAPPRGPVEGTGSGAAQRPGCGAALEGPAGGAAARDHRAGAVLRALDLDTRLTPRGRVSFREDAAPAHRPRGGAAPALLARVPLDPLLRFARLEGQVDPAGVDPEDLVFLDTETTGLAGGTGTLVVVAGLARLQGDHLRIRQFVLLDPADEAAFLAALAEDLAGARLLVTFNGRAFDWPVLEARFVLNRQVGAPPDLPHLDLLPAARRLYGADLPSCRLTDLEAHVLGARREADIPGSEVPLRYHMLLDGRPEPFRPVLDHNRHDLETLAALTAHAAYLSYRGLAGGEAPAGAPPEPGPEAGPTQLLALARSCLERGRFRRAEQLLREALVQAGAHRRGAAWFTAARLLSTLYRRQGRWNEAAALWSEIAAAYPPGAMWALTELAKEREHRARDLEAALRYTEQALELCRRRLLLGSLHGRRDLEALEHRRRRLMRRLGRAAADPSPFSRPPF